MRVLVYHNPDAGHTQRTPESLIAELQRAGHEVCWLHTGEPIPDGVGQRFDLVVTAGGDGSVGRAGRQLVGTGVPILPVPLGTANNLATALGAAPEDMLHRLARWDAQPFDVAIVAGIEGSRCLLEGFGVGAFADAADSLSDVGAVAAPFGVSDQLARDRRHLARLVRTRPPMNLDVEIDGERVPGSYVMVEVLNIGAIGPRVHLAPLADPADGWLDVALVTEETREVLAAVLDDTEGGEPTVSPLPTRRARHVALSLPADVVVHVDGKSPRATGGRVAIDVQPAALTILRGGSAPGDGPGPPGSVPTPLPSPPPDGPPTTPRRNPYR